MAEIYATLNEVATLILYKRNFIMTLDSSVTNPIIIKSFNTLAQRCEEVHKNAYDYSKVVFKTMNKDKVDIRCMTCNSWFKQSMSQHLRTGGCPQCSISNKAQPHKLTIDSFTIKAGQVHDYYYDYSKVKYVNNKTKVVIVCPKHGSFLQRPDSHLRGMGCKYCALENIVKPLQYSINDIKEKANLVHKNKYDYSEAIYTGILNSIEITCKEHGKFSQVVSDHLKGRGCPSCAISGFKTALPGLLYYLKVIKDSTTLYKVGITNRTIKERFNSNDMQYIQVLHQVHYKSGQDAYNEEQRILKEYKEFKYIGADVLSSGNTELFTINVLNL